MLQSYLQVTYHYNFPISRLTILPANIYGPRPIKLVNLTQCVSRTILVRRRVKKLFIFIWVSLK